MRHSFKLEDNVDKNKKAKTDYSLVFMIFFILVAVICIVVYFVINHSSTNSKKYIEKVDEDKAYVYTSKKIENTNNESDEVSYDKIPSINLEGQKYTQINNEIVNQYNKVVEQGIHNYEYDFNVSNHILSLIIKSTYYVNQNQENMQIKTFFNTYNIDLKNDKVLSNEEILDLFNISEEQVNTYLKSKFVSYYNELIQYEYFKKSECNYQCFLNNRGITTDYTKDVHYYVEDGKLTLFKFYHIDSEYDEAQYFQDTTYQFLIKK